MTKKFKIIFLAKVTTDCRDPAHQDDTAAHQGLSNIIRVISNLTRLKFKNSLGTIND